MGRRRATLSDWNNPQVLAALGVGLILFIGGGYGALSQGMIFAVLGIYVAVFPPVKRPHRMFEFGVLGLLGIFLLQAIPFPWKPSWQAELGGLELAIGSNWQGQRQLMLPEMLFYLALVLWVYVQVSLPINPERRRMGLQSLVGCISLLGVGVFVGNLLGWTHPFFNLHGVFTFLPSRNAMSLVLAVGGVLSLGLAFDALPKHPVRSIVNFSGLVGCCLGLLASYSRGGILIFLLGGVIWILITRQQLKKDDRWKLLLPICVWVLIGVLFLGGDTSQRIHHFITNDWRNGGDFRWLIYRDTFKMIWDHLLMGVGSGNFVHLFPLYREVSLGETMAIHPESDYLWWIVEWGLVGIAGLIALGWGMGLSLKQGGEHRDRYRKLAMVGLGMVLVHGIFDVSLHRVENGFLFAFLLGIARVSHDSGMETSAFSVGLKRLAGIVLSLGGAFLILGPFVNKPLASTQLVQWVKAENELEMAPSQWESRRDRINGALEQFPLSWELHALKAREALQARDFKTAEKASEVVLRLAAKQYQISKYIGDLWMPYRWSYALVAYRSSLKSCPDRDMRAKIFNRLIEQIRNFENGWSQLDMLSREFADLRPIFLVRVPSEFFETAFVYSLDNYDLALWSDQNLFQIFHRYGEGVDIPDRWIKAIRDEGLSERLWMQIELARWKSGFVDEVNQSFVLKVDRPNYPMYGEGATTAYLKALLKVDAGDFAAGLALVIRFYQKNSLEEAKEVLETLRNWNNAPPALFYWRARIHYELGEHDQAYVYWRRYFEAILAD